MKDCRANFHFSTAPTARCIWSRFARSKGSYEKNGERLRNECASDGAAKLHPSRRADASVLRLDARRGYQRAFSLSHGASAHSRLSTAFDGPTLYGIDSDADGVFGKIGEGGVAIDTDEDMVRLYDGFDIGSPNFSASMTISGPAPIIMAMYIAAAKRRFGPKVVPKLRGTIQADIFKEVQAQNETIFPTEASLRFLCDMIEYTTRGNAALVSGFDQRLSHRRSRRDASAAGGLHALEWFRLCGNVRRARHPGRSIRSAPFVLSRLRPRCRNTSRSLAFRGASGRSACAMFSAPARKAQMFKLHTQTSGRSLVAAEFKNNLTRTAAELMLAYMNGDELVPLKQRGRTVHDAERRMDPARRARAGDPAGGVGHFQTHHEHAERFAGDESGRACGRSGDSRRVPRDRAARRRARSGGTPLSAQPDPERRASLRAADLRRHSPDHRAEPLSERQRRHAGSETGTHAAARSSNCRSIAWRNSRRKMPRKPERALDKLADVVERGENCFPTLIEAAEVCSLGQITGRLQEVVGRFRPMV